MRIDIPIRFRKKLRNDEKWDARVTFLIENLEIYFTLSPCFFPNYTIHGIDHINSVLKLANALVPNDTLEQITPRDLAVLISAIVFHDIGMFITEDGLFKLLFTEGENKGTNYLDKYSWQVEWNMYLKRIKRYSDQELLSAFGTCEPIKEPSKDVYHLNFHDRLVYGEFIRRQHHRLAHDIAVKAFPGSRNRDVFENTGSLKTCRDIIGLIARSHGMPIRETETYIDQNYASANMPNNIPIFYLMVVLRLADCLDAGVHRAPVELEDRQEVPIAISNIEWKWNQCIDIDNYSWQNNAIYIQVTPSNTLEFVRIERWLNEVQHELDTSWSILAEKYPVGRYDLSIHRINSNLLKEATRKELGNQFLTREARLTANPNILKLLIQPLYGNDPSFGVREMIQNAVDACIERKHLEEANGTTCYVPEIRVCIDTKAMFFTIEDNGIGMNEDILINYYLSAGSSYRLSDNWIKEFTVDQKSIIPRTGKFGVGVLAAFLLGTLIHVKTRYINDTRGYEFEFKIETSTLNVSRVNCDVGTTIKIGLNSTVLETLLKNTHSRQNTYNWNDWYAFKTPTVRYFIDGCEFERHYMKYVPQKNNPVKGWFKFDSLQYKEFWWQYRYNSEYYCNGIAIPLMAQYSIGVNSGFSLPTPSISVIDADGKLDIDLSRTKVNRFPDEDSFIREAYKYYLAKLLTSNRYVTDWTDYRFNQAFDYGKLNSQSEPNYLVSQNGFTILTAPFAVAARITSFLEVCVLDGGNRKKLYELHPIIPVVFSPVIKGRVSDRIYKDIIDRSIAYHINAAHYSTTIKLSRVWGEKNSFNKSTATRKKSFKDSALERLTHSAYRRIDMPNIKTHKPFSDEYLNPEVAPVIAEYEVSIKSDLHKNIMLETIKQYLGDDIWIPYNMNDRRAKFPKAFNELSIYMDL